jgi:hypothetical protein
MEKMSINLEPIPFGITFTWKNKDVKITLKNGEDVIKLGREFANFLDKIHIEHTVEMSNIENL